MTEMEACNPEIREGWRQYWEGKRILEDYIIETRRVLSLTRSTIGSRCEVGSSKEDVKRHHPMTWQQVQKRSEQLKEYHVNVEDTQQEIAEALLRRGDVVEVIGAKFKSKYHQSSHRMAELQEEVEEVKVALW